MAKDQRKNYSQARGHPKRANADFIGIAIDKALRIQNRIELGLNVHSLPAFLSMTQG